MSGSNDLVRIDGGCHCGNVRFAFFRPPWEGNLPARACGCSFCVKHGGAYTSHPQGRIEYTVADPDRLERYRFGTRTADFLICRTCGVVPIVTSEIDGHLYAVVSVHAFEGIDPAAIEVGPVDFDGEGTGDRLDRRNKSWTGDVRETIGADA
jgi:hypothetical protein